MEFGRNFGGEGGNNGGYLKNEMLNVVNVYEDVEMAWDDVACMGVTVSPLLELSPRGDTICRCDASGNSRWKRGEKGERVNELAGRGRKLASEWWKLKNSMVFDGQTKRNERDRRNSATD